MNDVIAELDAELRSLIARRHELGPVFSVGVACWQSAVARELARLEFPPAEVESMLISWQAALAAELGIKPRDAAIRRRI